MYTLGISALTHDTAAALLSPSGEVIAAFEESKLLRQRESTGIPRNAIQFCLQQAGIGWQELAGVAVAWRPLRAWMRQAWFRCKTLPLAPLASGYYQARLLGELGRELNNFRILRLLAGHGPVAGVDHQLAHAASAFFASPFERATVLTLDEQGDGFTGMIAVGEATRIRPLRRIAFPHSPAWVYTMVTDLLGFTRRRDEHKTQWLALQGEPHYRDVFLQLLGARRPDAPRLNRRYFRRGFTQRMAFSPAALAALDLDPKAPRLRDATHGSRIAASLQHACSELVLALAEAACRQTGIRQLCLAGGLFLNSPLVADLQERFGAEPVFVQPAAGNEGTALGAAWLHFYSSGTRSRAPAPASMALGPEFTDEAAKRVLDNCKARYRWLGTEAEKLEQTIRLLQAGKIVAWCQGRAEFGPRALGHRSLLASPWAPYVKENLNEYIKHREGFRPFALSVPAEAADRYFTSPGPNPWLTTLARIRPPHRERLQAFTLPGDRVRLHVVGRAANPLFHRLLQQFGEQAPAPLLVNTSFNLFGEPLVVTPRDAVRSFFCSGVDALVLGNFLLTKD
ncbi:MAG: carbamoyltransferase [Acidobacteriia bacterium]|mgnify:CR=1 FL=1|nr:carbamoyltransferase [Terriglobia bacterium]